MQTSDRVQVNINDRVTIRATIGELRNWADGEDIENARRALRLRPHVSAERVAELAADILGEIPGAARIVCECCGARAFGPEISTGAPICAECYDLAGIDNECNDEDRRPTADEREYIAELLDVIQQNGGDTGRAMSYCDYLRD